MASNYDGDIKLSVGLDASKTKFSLKDLVNNIKRAFSSGDTQIRNMGLQMQKLKDNIDSTRNKLDELKNTKAPTKEFEQLNKQLDATKERLSTAKSELAEMEQMRTPTAEYQKLSDQLEELTQKRKMALSNIDYYEGKGDASGVEKAKAFYNDLEDQIKRVASALVDMEDSGKKYAESPELLQKREEVKQLENGVTGLQNKVDNLKASGLDIDFNVPKIQATEQKLGYLEQQADIMNQKFKEASGHATHFSDKIKSLVSTVGGVFKKIGGAIKTHTVDKWKQSTNSLKSNLRQVFRNIIGIQALIRVLRMAAGYAKEAFKDMALQYPEINAQLSDLISHFDQFKHSIATALQPLLNIVLPILHTIIDAFITAANAVGSFFAALTGQGFIYKAVKQQKSFAGAVGGTGGAAKEAKEELAEYDKLIVISSDDAGAGGGGGGAGGGSATAFEKSPISSEFTDLVDKIKEAWKNADFTDLGKELGQKITDGLNSIPWDKIKETAYKLGKSLATFLNGLISPDLFGALGRTLGETINTALSLGLGFVTNFNWRNLGQSLVTGFNNFLTTVNWHDLGKLLSTAIAGVFTTAAEFLRGLDTHAVWQSIKDFFDGIDWTELGKSVVELIFAAIGAALRTLVEIGTDIGDTVLEWFEEIGENGWDGLWDGFWNAVYDIATWLDEQFHKYIIDPIKELLGIASPSKVFEEIGGWMMEGLLNGLTAFWTQIEEWVLGAVRWIEEKFGGVSGVIEAALGVNTATSEVGSTVVDIAKKEQQRQENSRSAKEEADRRGVSTWEVIGDRTGNFERKNVADIEKSAEHAFEAVDKLKSSFEKLPKASKKAYNGVTKAFSDSASWAQNTADGISKGFDKMPNEVETKFKGAYTKSTDEFKGINQWARNTERDTVTGFNNLPSDVEQKYRSANSQGRSQFDGAIDWARAVVNNIDLGFSGMPREVQERYKKSYTDGISEFANAMQWAQGRSDAIGIGFNGLAGLVQNRFKDSYSKGTSEFANSKQWAQGVTNNISTGLSGLPAAIQNKFKAGYGGAQTESNNFMGWLKNQDFTAKFKIETPTQNWLQEKFNGLASIWKDQDAEFTVNANGNVGGLNMDRMQKFVDATNVVISQINDRLNTLKQNKLISGVKTLAPVSMPAKRYFYAKGAVIPPNRQFLGVLGDQPEGINIETPLKTMVEAFEMALDSRGGSNGSPIILQLDGRTVAQVVWDANERRYKQTGRS